VNSPNGPSGPRALEGCQEQPDERSGRDSEETPQEPIQRDTDVGQLLRALTPKGRFFSYGLGFILEEYGGHKLI